MSTDRNHLIWQAHLRTAEQVLAHYEGEEPFPVYLKSFFKENPKFGSRDRRRMSQLCFQFFRLGQALSGFPLKERILAGVLLSAPKDEILDSGFFPEVSTDMEDGYLLDKKSCLPYGPNMI
jgi:16S rRNA (cytosine967-C5)-methyltransferase